MRVLPVLGVVALVAGGGALLGLLHDPSPGGPPRARPSIPAPTPTSGVIYLEYETLPASTPVSTRVPTTAVWFVEGPHGMPSGIYGVPCSALACSATAPEPAGAGPP